MSSNKRKFSELDKKLDTFTIFDDLYLDDDLNINILDDLNTDSIFDDLEFIDDIINLLT